MTMYRPKAYFGTDLNTELNTAIKAFVVYLDVDNGGDQPGVQGCCVNRARLCRWLLFPIMVNIL